MTQSAPAAGGRAATGASLVARFLRSDQRAASAIHQHLIGTVRGALRRWLPDSTDVEDASQEVFVRLYRRLPELKVPEHLVSFARGIAIHVALAERRRLSRRPRLELGLPEQLARRRAAACVGARRLQ